jgi:hypothetical protein
MFHSKASQRRQKYANLPFGNPAPTPITKKLARSGFVSMVEKSPIQTLRQPILQKGRAWQRTSFEGCFCGSEEERLENKRNPKDPWFNPQPGQLV